MRRNIFWTQMHCEVCIQSYFTWISITYNRSLFIIILWFDSSDWKIEDRNKLIQQFTGKLVWIWQYFRTMLQTLRYMCSAEVMEVGLGCHWVLFSSQRFKRWVNTILEITSFDWFFIDWTQQFERNSDSSLSSFGCGYTIINLKSSN